MSYNYDVNPWDDNYSQQGQQNNANSASYGSYNQQSDSYNYNSYNQQEQQQFQYQEEQQQYSDESAKNNQQPTYNEDKKQQNPSSQSSSSSSSSWLTRFLRQHVPLCGLCMDTMSSINLPFIDALVQHINRDLLISKIFYFFFYSAFGSLFPLMGVYFKQLGMNPAQVGILTGVRPFIEIFSAPFWHSLAERFHKSKALLMFSLFSWIIFTYFLNHIRPPASACVAFNDTVYLLYTPYSANDLSNYDVGGLEAMEEKRKEAEEGGNEMFMNKPPESAMENEGKDAILASEENQNDQRRRRRRKRQTIVYENDDENRDKARYTYSVLKDPSLDIDEDNDLLPKSEQGVEIELDTDFDDRLIEKPRLTLYDRVNNVISGPRNEYQSSDRNNPDPSKRESNMFISLRQKRQAREDDIFGESDEPEPEEERPSIKEERQNKMKSNKVNEDQESDEELEEDREEQENEKGRKKQVTMAPTTTTTTTTTRATSTTETIELISTPSDQTPKSRKVYKQRHKTPPTHIVGMSPITVEYAANYNKEKHSQFVTPMFSTIVYKLDDIKEVFFLLLLLISLGEFFSAPAITLADSATLSYLGDNTDLYGRQRLFGSLSWAITLLLVGMALDNSTSIADHPCGPHPRERSYTVCFAIFSLLMGCALLTATQFRFTYSKSSSGNQQALIVASTADSKTIVTKTIDGNTVEDLYASTQPRSIFNTAPPVNAPPPNATNSSGGKDKFEYLEKWKSAVFAQNTKELPEWVNVFRQFKNSMHLTYLFITWFLGCGVGLVFTFLFWHLQDVGGTPTLFGICSVINHISEILAYFFSFSFIKRFGHTKVLSFGLGCNVIRFLYVAFLTNPYYALPFELVQGITHAACFAACCSYISHVSKPELRTSTQGVMQGLHHGIGRACGTIIGGYMINAIGSRASFCIYGLLSGCVLAGFLYVRKKASEMKDEEVKVDDSEALGGYGAPQGVPSAIPVANQQTQQTDIDYQW